MIFNEDYIVCLHLKYIEKIKVHSYTDGQIYRYMDQKLYLHLKYIGNMRDHVCDNLYPHIDAELNVNLKILHLLKNTLYLRVLKKINYVHLDQKVYLHLKYTGIMIVYTK